LAVKEKKKIVKRRNLKPKNLMNKNIFVRYDQVPKENDAINYTFFISENYK
jgi:hypothetical protein